MLPAVSWCNQWEWVMMSDIRSVHAVSICNLCCDKEPVAVNSKSWITLITSGCGDYCISLFLAGTGRCWSAEILTEFVLDRWCGNSRNRYTSERLYQFPNGLTTSRHLYEPLQKIPSTRKLPRIGWLHYYCYLNNILLKTMTGSLSAVGS